MLWFFLETLSASTHLANLTIFRIEFDNQIIVRARLGTSWILTTFRRKGLKKIEENRLGGWGGRIACESTISPHPATYGGEREGGKGAKSLKNWRVKKFQPNIIFQLKQRSSTLPWKVAIRCHPATKSKQTQCQCQKLRLSENDQISSKRRVHEIILRSPDGSRQDQTWKGGT